MEHYLIRFFATLVDLYLDTAIWLLGGLVLAALLKGALPGTLVQRWLGGKGAAPVVRGALIGAPLPLCSCGVLPAAIGLHRAGASRPATVSFLIATPETGVDSIAVSYALLGPVMAVVRPLAALFSAISTGLLVLLAAGNPPPKRNEPLTSCCSSTDQTDSCSGFAVESTSAAAGSDSCSSDNSRSTASGTASCCSSSGSSCGSGFDSRVDAYCDANAGTEAGTQANTQAETGTCSRSTAANGEPRGWRAGYEALIDLLDDIKRWLLFGLLLAALFGTLVEPAALTAYGSGIGAMLLMLVVGLPLYICATASTPIAAVMLAAGFSPGAVLVFMLVGPATNIGAIGLLVKELGSRVVALYLGGIVTSALLLGSVFDLLVDTAALQLPATGSAHGSLLWLQLAAAIVLTLLMIRPLRERLLPAAKNAEASCCDSCH